MCDNFRTSFLTFLGSLSASRNRVVYLTRRWILENYDTGRSRRCLSHDLRHQGGSRTKNLEETQNFGENEKEERNERA